MKSREKTYSFIVTFFSLVMCCSMAPTQARHLPIGEPESDSSKVGEFLSKIKVDDEIDFEDALDEYYDAILDEIEMLKEDLEKVKKMEEEEKEKKNLAVDYDYLSDMAVPGHETPDKKPKAMESTIENGNFTWTYYNGTNTTMEDLHVYQKLSRDSQNDENVSERMKQLRLNAIKSQILSMRGSKVDMNETITPGMAAIAGIQDTKQFETFREIYEKSIRKNKGNPSNNYAERTGSFFPSCEVPRNVTELWSDGYAMNLYFDLDYPKPAENSTIDVIGAKLRLYKLSQGNFSIPSSLLKSGTTIVGIPGYGFLPSDDDRQIRITVHWYSKSVRRNRGKRTKILASHMFPIYGEEWTEFNIRTAVRSWKKLGKNFGLMVTVEDEEGTLLPVEQYLHAMNCTSTKVGVRPIPSILRDSMDSELFSSKNDSNGGRFQNLLYPVVDLTTIEVPDSEDKSSISFDPSKLSAGSPMLNLKKSSLNANTANYTILENGEKSESRNLQNNNKSERTSKKKSSERHSGSASFQTSGLGFPTGLGSPSGLGAPPSASSAELSPSAGPGRNFLVPLKTKSEIDNSELSETELKKGYLRMQGDGPFSDDITTEGKKSPQIRHNHKQWAGFEKERINLSKLRKDSKEIVDQ